MISSYFKGLRKINFPGQLRFAAAIALFASISFPVFAVQGPTGQSVTVAWNPVTDPGTAGYILFYGTTNGSYATNINVGTNTSAVVSGLVPGQTNYFSVAAYNSANLQGPNSPAMAYIVPGKLEVSSIGGLNLSFPVSPGHYYVVEASTNLSVWTNIWQSSTQSSNIWLSYQDTQASSFSRRFYRLVLH